MSEELLQNIANMYGISIEEAKSVLDNQVSANVQAKTANAKK